MEIENYSAYYNRENFKFFIILKMFFFNLFYAYRKEDADEKEKMNSKMERPRKTCRERGEDYIALKL